jgi:phenylacetate-CoA ligase
MATLISKLKSFGLSDRLIRRHPLLYPRIQRELEAFDRLDAAARRRWQRERLRKVLQAASRSAYGRKAGASGFLGDWPILEKDVIRQNPEAFRVGRWPAVGATTSGTTGTPLQLHRSLTCVVAEQVMVDRMLASGGVSPQRCRAAVLRGDDVKSLADRSPPFWQLANGGQRLLFSSNHLDADSVGHFVEALRRYRPDVILAYPTALESLCSLMLQRGDRLQVPLTGCSSEVLSKATSDLARAALGTRVIGYYGQAERVAWAEGDPDAGYRFDPTYAAVELRLTESDDELDTYEVIGTGLWNTAMPLVRYRTGDQIKAFKGSNPAAIAEGREKFHSIVGRSNDYIVAPSGAHLIAINHIPRNVPHVVRAQFVQNSVHSVTLLVVPGPGFDDESRKLLLEHASVKLPPSMDVRIETTTQLLRNRSGKAPLVVRNLSGGV